MHVTTGRPAPARGGFSLIELLVVIAIIAILMSLVAAGTFQYMAVQQVSSTETSLQTITQVFRKHWSKVVENAKKETPIPATVLSLAGGDMARAKVIWVKIRLMEAFPMTYAEIGKNPNDPIPYSQGWIPIGSRQYMGSYQGKLSTATLANNKAGTQSAACLLMALSIGHGGVPPLDVDKVSTADTDGDGLKELVDAWGNPLVFYRFPTPGLTSDLQQANPTTGAGAKFADPLDPTGTLVNLNTWTKALQTQFQQQIHPISPNGAAPTYYVNPVIVSMGRNGKLGLDTTTMAVTTQNDANDNIYSYQLKEGKGS